MVLNERDEQTNYADAEHADETQTTQNTQMRRSRIRTLQRVWVVVNEQDPSGEEV